MGIKRSLFPVDLPDSKWIMFQADGFDGQVSGVIYRMARPPCCGVPLGGVATGCVDIDARGVWGFSSLFNPISSPWYDSNWRMPRKLPRAQPILGLSVDEKTWVLASEDFLSGKEQPWCTEPRFVDLKDLKLDQVSTLKPQSVHPAREIHYWGHYPIADLEFETDAPVSVGLRAWSPFIPGDIGVSNTPAAIFEVRLRNQSDRTHQGTIALNFPGPDTQEARAVEFTRQQIGEDFVGVLVSSTSGVQYILGVIGEERVRLGGGLNEQPGDWSRIAVDLPRLACREVQATRLYRVGSSSAAVDFDLKAGEEKRVNFLLAWYAPLWEGTHKSRLEELKQGWHHYQWVGERWGGNIHYFTPMYAARYRSALDVARRVAAEHQTLLQRVLAWQSVIYAEESLPAWLRDSLVNNLALIAEDSYWAQARPPLGDWAYPQGLFALNESPRGCPDLATIPCDWYGNLPVVFFFPDLFCTTLRGFKAYQKDDGEVPLLLGIVGDLPEMAVPAYYWQVSLNGMCYVDLVDRQWQRTGDDTILEEFYDSVKKANTFTINLKKGPGGSISMPEIGGMEWFEFGEWAGMAAHLGGLRLAQLRMMIRMAEYTGDKDYADQCRDWLEDGSRAMEDELWAGGYYLNFYEKESGKKSDDVMGYQLDGQWAALFHGLAGVFRPERVRQALETIKRCNIALTPEVGAANFSHPDGSRLLPEVEGAEKLREKTVAAYGAFAMFPPELLVLAMTYIYAGEEEFGLDLARRHWENLVCRQRHPWDLPNIVRGDSGERVFGTDYYQNMMLWALPAVLGSGNLRAVCQDDGLVERVLRAGRGGNTCEF